MKIKAVALLVLVTALFPSWARAWGGVAPSALQCSVLFSGVKPQPVDRFGIRIEFVRNATSSAQSKLELVDRIADDDVRKVLMQLQGLAKIYEASDLSEQTKAEFKEFRMQMKEVEGYSGDLGRVKDLYNRSKEIGVSKQLLSKIDDRVHEKRKEIAAHLKDLKWWPDLQGKMAELEERIGDLDFQKRKKDSRRQIEAVLNIVDETRTELKGLAEFFSHETFEEDELNNGPHRMRRALRWITTIMQSAEGTFTLADPHPKTPFERALAAKYGSNKYIVLSPVGRAAIDPIPLMYLAKFVTELGKLKDYKETQLDLAQVFLDEGWAKNRTEAEQKALEIAAKKYGPIIGNGTGAGSVETEARKLYRLYLAKDPLKALHRSLKSALEDLND